jgi:hypothetical protein
MTGYSFEERLLAFFRCFIVYGLLGLAFFGSSANDAYAVDGDGGRSFQQLVAAELADSDYQTALPGPREQPEPPDWDLPDWLITLLKFIGDILYYVLIGTAILGVALLLWLFLADARGWQMPFWKKKEKPEDKPEPTVLTGSTRQAGETLVKADALLQDGYVVGALRLLLQLAIGELVSQRVLRITRDQTGREIVAQGERALKDHASLAVIVSAIERHLFAGQPVDGDIYEACRNAYTSLTQSLKTGGARP